MSIDDPKFWLQRLKDAKLRGELHRTVFVCPVETWRQIEEAHRAILAECLQPNTSVLDAGCGYGALLDVMPAWWTGDYIGVDQSPDLIAVAESRHPGKLFAVSKLETFDAGGRKFDLAVLRSIRPMVLRVKGAEAWKRIESNVRKHADRLLYLEYDPSRGEIAEWN